MSEDIELLKMMRQHTGENADDLEQMAMRTGEKDLMLVAAQLRAAALAISTVVTEDRRKKNEAETLRQAVRAVKAEVGGDAQVPESVTPIRERREGPRLHGGTAPGPSTGDRGEVPEPEKGPN